MSDDIVHELRTDAGAAHGDGVEDSLQWRAADEIERLRASRNEVLEEAAKVADQRAEYWDQKDDGNEMGPMMASGACAGVAAAIRALKAEATNHTKENT